MLLTLAAWILPFEVAQTWAVDRAAKDEFARFEAFEAATATVWFSRWAMTVIVVVLSVAWIRRRRVIPLLIQVVTEFWQTSAASASPSSAPKASLRSTVVRLFIVAWLALAVCHAGLSIQRRLWDWPVYRLNDGHYVLPNISDTNRDVIRYLEATTRPGSKILVLSDQKLFFLSYYLLPRRLYHPTHPESEFVIAQPYNQRQLVAYRLQDLSADRIERLKPDYILEYFEGKTYIQGEDLHWDSQWLSFQQRRHGPTWRPQYLVNLRRHLAGGVP